MYMQNKMQKSWYVSIGTAAILAATMGMGTAMAGTLDSTWKEATLPQVKALLAKDTGKATGDTVTYSGKTVHVVAASSPLQSHGGCRSGLDTWLPPLPHA